jgi:isocitrate dehydrogenase kinase/phosphatase
VEEIHAKQIMSLDLDLPSTDRLELAASSAAAIHLAYQDYQDEFHKITRRSKARFEDCDWRGMQADALERLELYKKVITRIVVDLRLALGEQARDRDLWATMRSEYSQEIACCTDYLLAETFYNSVTRRIFSTVGVDSKIEFVDSDFELRPVSEGDLCYDAFQVAGESESPEQALEAVLHAILEIHAFHCGYEDLPRDARLAAEAIQEQLRGQPGGAGIERIEVLPPEFFRNFGAYIIGRIITRPARPGGQERIIPLALCLRNQGQGILVDAVLTDEDEVSIVFSFTRSYFHVDVGRPHELVAFLKSIMPLKRIAELYISIGYNKHGKTELYRELLRHLASSTDPFDIAPGERGMVMAVFTLPSFDMVFKIIKDRIDPPKTTSRQEVMERYDLVFRHDKAGRLIDAQEFEHLTFEKRRFSPALLAELQAVAPRSVVIGEDTVDIQHLYCERRMTPLNLYIKQNPPEAAEAAVIDYGRAIKDLAATNIFPGDVLLKNFGVTRHGRVVFYDYDELCHVTDCKFRKMPQPRNHEDEYEADPWFYVGPLDIFPEEFRTFLGLQEPLRGVFIQHHQDLFTPDFWKQMQARHRAGEVVDIVPYPDRRRLRHGEKSEGWLPLEGQFRSHPPDGLG